MLKVEMTKELAAADKASLPVSKRDVKIEPPSGAAVPAGMKLEMCGDLPGHPFRGNQYQSGEGGGGNGPQKLEGQTGGPETQRVRQAAYNKAYNDKVAEVGNGYLDKPRIHQEAMIEAERAVKAHLEKNAPAYEHETPEQTRERLEKSGVPTGLGKPEPTRSLTVSPRQQKYLDRQVRDAHKSHENAKQFNDSPRVKKEYRKNLEGALKEYELKTGLVHPLAKK